MGEARVLKNGYRPLETANIAAGTANEAREANPAA